MENVAPAAAVVLEHVDVPEQSEHTKQIGEVQKNHGNEGQEQKYAELSVPSARRRYPQRVRQPTWRLLEHQGRKATLVR